MPFFETFQRIIQRYFSLKITWPRGSFCSNFIRQLANVYNIIHRIIHAVHVIQAKKMNVESLRSNHDANAQSAEVRIAKAAITICFLFIAAWTPYAAVAMIGAFGDQWVIFCCPPHSYFYWTDCVMVILENMKTSQPASRYNLKK